jgi:hypothetical protein
MQQHDRPYGSCTNALSSISPSAVLNMTPPISSARCIPNLNFSCPFPFIQCHPAPQPLLLMSQCKGDQDTIGAVCPEWLTGGQGDAPAAVPPPASIPLARSAVAASASRLVLGVAAPGAGCAPQRQYELLSSTSTPMALNLYATLLDPFDNPVAAGSAEATATVIARVDGASFIGVCILKCPGHRK